MHSQSPRGVRRTVPATLTDYASGDAAHIIVYQYDFLLRITSNFLMNLAPPHGACRTGTAYSKFINMILCCARHLPS